MQEEHMDLKNRVIGIELSELEGLVRAIVREEMANLLKEIKEVLVSKQELLLREERLYTNDVAKVLGVTRHTVLNYRTRGELPEPRYDASRRPYWTPEQLENVLRLHGIKGKYPL